MTVEWILNRLFNPPSNEGNRNNSSTSNINNNMNPTIRPILSGPIYPIITSNSINNQNIPNNININDNRLQPDHPDYGTIYNTKDGFQRDLNLPIFSPNYPAFFVLVLLVTLTSFALFVLLFLCCLDVSGKDAEGQKEEVEEALPDEPEPPFKEVGVGTESEISQIDHVVEMENQVETMENEEIPAADESSSSSAECPVGNEMGIMEIQIEEPLTLKHILKANKNV